MLIVTEIKIRVPCFFREMFNQSWNKSLSLSSDLHRLQNFHALFFSSQEYGRLSLHRFLNCTPTHELKLDKFTRESISLARLERETWIYNCLYRSNIQQRVTTISTTIVSNEIINCIERDEEENARRKYSRLTVRRVSRGGTKETIRSRHELFAK